MSRYKLEVQLTREKVLCIKFIRAITLWGLKDCKDFVERNFTFDEWGSEWTTFEIIVTDVQLAHAAHFCINDSFRTSMTECTVLPANEANPFDFTGEPS